MFNLPVFARRVATAIAGLSLVTVLAPAVVVAAPPAAQALNPEPPDTYTCAPVGSGTICRADVVEPYDDATGIWCGSGANSFEIIDSGARHIRATRWYDGNGDLTRRVRILDFEDARLTNAVTGTSVGYHQHNTDWDVLAVPGDLGSSTWHGHGSFTVTVPGAGVVMLGAGVEVHDPNGDLVHRGGPSVEDIPALCAALGG